MAALEDLRREPLKESEIKLAVEAVLFSSSRALMVREIAQAVGAEPRKVKRALTGLKREYQKRQTSVEVAKIGTKWTLQLKNRFVPVAAGYASTKIPKNLLKTVALIAYHQPFKQSELLNMVGQRVYDHVHALEDLKVVRHIPWGNSKILFTTHRFSEIFGIEGNSRDDIKRWMAKQIGIPAEQVDRDIKKSHEKEKQLGGAVAENEAADAAAKAEAAAAVAGADPSAPGAPAGEE
jgi:segregation and condensation protein B